MTNFPFDLIGFDLDGTLFDTSGDLANAVNATLASINIPPLSLATVRGLIGGGGRHMLAQAIGTRRQIDDTQLDQLYAQFLSEYRKHIAVETKPYPGLVGALDELAERGVKLAIVTNKREDMTLALLDELGWRNRFAVIIGAGTLPGGVLKPDPAPLYAMIERSRCTVDATRAAFVGDSRFDVEAARNAGIPSIAVSFGYSDCPALELGADAVIDHYDELIDKLTALSI